MIYEKKTLEGGKMKNKTSQISKSQLFFLIVQTQIGVGLLSMPYVVHLDAQNDGWISVGLAGNVVFVLLFIIWSLCKRYPKDTIFEFNDKILGKALGSILSMVYIIYFASVSILIVELSTSMLKEWVLLLTPQWVLIIFFISVGFYLSRENLKIIARFNVFVSVFIFILIFLVLFTYTDVHFTYIFPVGQSGFINIFKGSHDAIVSMLGFEILLVAYPMTKAKENQIFKYASLAIFFVTILYMFFTFTSYIVFSKDEIMIVPEPILYMLKALNIELIERIDLVFLALWVVPMTTSFVSYLHLTSLGVGKFIKKYSHKHHCLIVAVLLLAISVLLPNDESFAQKFGELISRSSYLFIGIIPLFLLVISLIRKKNVKENRYEA
jgi:spore germination protein (amino acid permease)